MGEVAAVPTATEAAQNKPDSTDVPSSQSWSQSQSSGFASSQCNFFLGVLGAVGFHGSFTLSRKSSTVSASNVPVAASHSRTRRATRRMVSFPSRLKCEGNGRTSQDERQQNCL